MVMYGCFGLSLRKTLRLRVKHKGIKKFKKITPTIPIKWCNGIWISGFFWIFLAFDLGERHTPTVTLPIVTETMS